MTNANYKKIDIYRRTSDGIYVYYVSTNQSATCKVALIKAKQAFPCLELKASFATVK